MRRRIVLFAVALLCLAAVCFAQESRGSISGVVTDPQDAVIPGAAVTITNTDTNVSQRVLANQTGYFQADLLDPGTYSVSAEVQGFKKSVRTGLSLSVAGRLDLKLQLEVGQATQTVEVTAEAPLLDTTSAGAGRVIDTKEVRELPFNSMNPLLLQHLSPGVQYTGDPEFIRPFDIGGSSQQFNTMGNVGQNEYLLDGAPVTGTNQRVGYVPSSEAVDEFRIQTAAFDASYGHSSGAVVTTVSKSGTNVYHGSLFDQHWQQRWNATPHFTRLQYEADLASGKKKAGDQRQDPGRSNIPGFTIGGPVRIPWVINGRDKLFFFFQWNGIFQRQTELGVNLNYTVPKMAWRQGDFSDLLAVDAVKYTVYDPRSARLSGSRVVRTPFPGNQGVPILNPVYKWWVRLYPEPNNVPGLVAADGTNNLFASGQPKDEDFNSTLNRYDYSISDKHRVNGKWYWNHRNSHNYDWAYTTPLKGLMESGQIRINKGGSADYIFVMSSRHMLNIGFSLTQFQEGSQRPPMIASKASDLGLPKYLDEKAGPYTMVPYLAISGQAGARGNQYSVYPGIQSYATTGELKAQMVSILSRHSLKYGWSERRYVYASWNPGNTEGRYSFSNTYFRAADNTTTAGTLGLSWAAFLMGLPDGVTIDTNDTALFSTRYRALYLQDEWRISSRFRLGFGLRYEREGGITERYNRALAGGFDYGYRPPFADAVEAAYAKSPLPELAAGQFKVLGGTYYLGQPDKTFTNGAHRFLPNVSLVHGFNAKTVLRVGYGWFYDTFNPNNYRPLQQGYSQATTTTVSTDNGLTFCCGIGAAAGISAGANVMGDPFPVRADGTRFDRPYGNSLGPNVMQGSSYAVYPRDYSAAWQQRWRIGLQREIGANTMIDVSYNGSSARRPGTVNLSYLPGQYWATGNVRVQSQDDFLLSNFPNPFNISNLAGLRTSSATLYNYLSVQSMFTGTTRRRQQLLRAYPNFNSAVTGIPAGVDRSNYDDKTRYHDVQIQFERRFRGGLRTVAVYTRAYSRVTYRMNEFDPEQSWQANTSVMPHRFAWSAVYELPFGKGRRWVTSSPLQHLVGGWGLSWIYQRQNGAPTSWGNVFFYGDQSNIASALNHDAVHSQDVHLWFDPKIRYTTGTGAIPSGFVGFEGRSAFQPGQYHARVFPNLLEALRVDGLRNWDAKLSRRFKITERLNTSFAVDLLNATNHTNYAAPNLDPTKAEFGRLTTQLGNGRMFQFNLRVDF